MGDTVQGQGGGNQTRWQGDPLQGGVPTGGAADGTSRKEARKKRAHQAVHQHDVQESALNKSERTSGRRTQAHLERGGRFPTFNPDQLNSDSSDPHIPDPRHVAASPPQGPGGTGNPFFRPNPMTTFFTMFLTLLQAMKELQRVSVKLTIIQMQGIKETGLAQAHATLQAGKEQAKAEREQAVMSFIQGGMAAAMFLKSVHTDLQANKMAANTLKQERQTAKELQHLSNKQEANVDDVEHKIAGKNNFLNSAKHDPMMKVEPKGKILKEMAEDTTDVDMAAKATKVREHADKKFEAAQAKLEQVEVKATKKEIEQAKKEAQTALKQRKEAIEDEEFFKNKLEYGKPTTDKDAYKKQVRNEMEQLKPEAFKLRSDLTATKTKATESWSQADQYDMKGTNIKAWQTRTQFKNSDPWYQGMLGLKDIGTNILEGLKHLARATGEQQNAYWQSDAQIYGTYNQLMKTGLDSTINMARDAYQQGGELCSTLIKMSDQQTQSMHWAA